MRWSRLLRTEVVVLFVLLASAGAVGVLVPGASEASDYAVLDEAMLPFRSDFNAASDHARAVLLVGPT